MLARRWALRRCGSAGRHRAAAVGVEPLEGRALMSIMVGLDPITRSQGSEATPRVDLEVSLLVPTSERVTVEYEIGGQSLGVGLTVAQATRGVDFRADQFGQVTFEPGETRKFITLEVVNDDLLEPEEYIRVHLKLATPPGTLISHVHSYLHDRGQRPDGTGEPHDRGPDRQRLQGPDLLATRGRSGAPGIGDR